MGKLSQAYLFQTNILQTGQNPVAQHLELGKKEAQ
jgi:hypothetical protein